MQTYTHTYTRMHKSRACNRAKDTPLCDADVLCQASFYFFLQNGQFDVGDGKKFKTLDALVDHFKQAPMVETSGSVVRLKQPVNATRVISSHIHGRISDLMKVAAENFGKAGFWEEFEQLQQQEHKNLHSRKEGAKLENKKKNRYKNILPCESLRLSIGERVSSGMTEMV